MRYLVLLVALAISMPAFSQDQSFGRIFTNEIQANDQDSIVVRDTVTFLKLIRVSQGIYFADGTILMSANVSTDSAVFSTRYWSTMTFQPIGIYLFPSDTIGNAKRDFVVAYAAPIGHLHTGVYQPAGVYATPSSLGDSLNERANDYQALDDDLTDLADGTLSGSKVQSNSSSAAGVVASGSGQANQVWKTDGSGNPAWRPESGLDTTRFMPMDSTNAAAADTATNVLAVQHGKVVLVRRPNDGDMNRSDSTSLYVSRYVGFTDLSTNYTPYWNGSRYTSSGLSWSGNNATFAGSLTGPTGTFNEWMSALNTYVGNSNQYAHSYVLDKAGNTYLLWLSRNTTYSEVVWDMSRLGSIAMATAKRYSFDYSSPITSKLHGLPFIMQSNLLSWEDVSTVEYWNGSAWATWSTSAGYWKPLTDNISSTVSGIDQTHKSFRISYDVGNPWNYATAVVIEQPYGTHGPRQYGILIEGDDNASFTSPETLAQDSVISSAEIAAFPFNGNGYQYVRFSMNCNITAADMWVNLAEVRLLTHRPGDQGGTGVASWMPFSWDFNRNLTFYGNVNGKNIDRVDSAVVVMLMAGTSWLAPSNTDSLSGPIPFDKSFVVDSIKVWLTGAATDTVTFDVRFGPDPSVSGYGTGLQTTPAAVNGGNTWRTAVPNNATIPAGQSAFVFTKKKVGTPKRGVVVLKGRWISG